MSEAVKLEKSVTVTSTLPSINKFLNRYRGTETERTKGQSRMKSMFIEKVKAEITHNTQYEFLETSIINQEQKQLKHLLRSFNQETYNIMNDFIDFPKEQNLIKHKSKSVSEVARAKEREIHNKQQIIEQCLTEIKVLQARCDNLRYMTHEEMEKQIILTHQQIDKVKGENKAEARCVTLNGLHCCKGTRFNEIKEAEYDKLIIDTKKTTLQDSEKEVQIQLDQLKQKHQKIDQILAAVDEEMKLAVKLQNEGNLVELHKETLKEKKKAIEAGKHRIEQINLHLKYKYLHKLKQLDQTTSSITTLDKQAVALDFSIDSSKKELVLFESKLAIVRQAKKMKPNEVEN